MSRPVAPDVPGVLFADVTDASGVDFVHDRGATGRRYLPEIMGAGGCALDADGDSRLDLYLVQSGVLPGSGRPQGPAFGNRLWRNLGDGRFEDVTQSSGTGDAGFGMGATCADFDGDGWGDIHVANFGPDVLYRNRGDGTFEDVTVAAGVGNSGFSSTAAFLDADGDGDLDLFVVDYVDFTVAGHVTCVERGVMEAYCHPDAYAPAPDVYYRNRGDGTFEDATEAAGFGRSLGKGLGVVVLDFDGDGDPDLHVTNDSTPNFLWRNRGDGTFDEVGLALGAAFSEDGLAEAGMGVDAGDVDGDGWMDLVVTNYAGEANALLLGSERGFRHASRRLGIRAASLPFVGFGTDLFDVDDDGDLDLFVLNGHIIDNIAEADPSQSFAQPAQVFLNDGTGRLSLLPAGRAGSVAVPAVGRGSITWDPDSDGRLDLVLTSSGGRARLHRNVAEPAGHWIGFELRGNRPNPDAIGARVTLEAGGRRQVAERQCGSSYQTSGDPRLHFGLGAAEVASALTVRWPDGSVETHAGLAAGRYYRLVQGGAPLGLTP